LFECWEKTLCFSNARVILRKIQGVSFTAKKGVAHPWFRRT
jgi:hypothetical protein